MNDWIIDNLNYARDRRNCELAKPPVLYIENDEFCGEIELPTKWGVCPVCDGEGKHVNPAIDCGGLSSDDFDEDPDFADNYRSEMYDIACNNCGGRSTVPEVDWNRLSAEQAKAYREQLQDEANARAEYLAEIRAGA